MESTLIKETDIMFKGSDMKWNFEGRQIKWDMIFFTLALVIANISLLKGAPAGFLAYNEAAIEAGQWWRFFTFPFAHVSIYNLLLDGSAFLMLYHGLEEESTKRRIIYAASTMSASLIIPLLLSPVISVSGLCGLSGSAHGLMAVTGLELIRRAPRGDMLNKTGWLLFIIVLAKGMIEAYTGQVMFSALHFGDVGTPVAESHLGGIIGGLIAFLYMKRVQT